MLQIILNDTSWLGKPSCLSSHSASINGSWPKGDSKRAIVCKVAPATAFGFDPATLAVQQRVSSPKYELLHMYCSFSKSLPATCCVESGQYRGKISFAVAFHEGPTRHAHAISAPLGCIENTPMTFLFLRAHMSDDRVGRTSFREGIAGASQNASRSS